MSTCFTENKCKFFTFYRSKSLCKRTHNRQIWLFKKQCSFKYIFSESHELIGIAEKQNTTYLKIKKLHEQKKIYRKNQTTPSIYSMNPNFPRETSQKTVNVFSPEKTPNVSKQTDAQINYTTKISNRSKLTRKGP